VNASAPGEYPCLFPAPIQLWLDRGRGTRVLADPAVGHIVNNTFGFFKGDDCCLDSWVIASDRPRVVLLSIGEHDLEDILRTWKASTGNAVNRTLGRNGVLWQKGSCDHIVRSQLSLAKVRMYIRDNPRERERDHVRCGTVDRSI